MSIFPGIKEKYQHKYGNAYEVMSENNPALMKLFLEICNTNHILSDTRQIFSYLSNFRLKIMTGSLIDNLFDFCKLANKGLPLSDLNENLIYKIIAMKLSRLFSLILLCMSLFELRHSRLPYLQFPNP